MERETGKVYIAEVNSSMHFCKCKIYKNGLCNQTKNVMSLPEATLMLHPHDYMLPDL